MTTIKDCPHCGFEDGLETFLRIDLDDVVIEDGVMVSFTLAGSANDPSNGIVVEEANITCCNCGERVEGYIPMEVSERWTFDAPPTPVVLTIRDPDYENFYATDGEVETIDIDLGGQFDGPKGFRSMPEDEQQEWIDNVRQEVAHLPEDGNVRKAVDEMIANLLDKPTTVTINDPEEGA